MRHRVQKILHASQGEEFTYASQAKKSQMRHWPKNYPMRQKTEDVLFASQSLTCVKI